MTAYRQTYPYHPIINKWIIPKLIKLVKISGSKTLKAYDFLCVLLTGAFWFCAFFTKLKFFSNFELLVYFGGFGVCCRDGHWPSAEVDVTTRFRTTDTRVMVVPTARIDMLRVQTTFVRKVAGGPTRVSSRPLRQMFDLLRVQTSSLGNVADDQWSSLRWG